MVKLLCSLFFGKYSYGLSIANYSTKVKAWEKNKSGKKEKPKAPSGRGLSP
jgi:hypothetical protein